VNWYAIEVRTEPDKRDQVAQWLVERTGQAIEERADGTLVSFAPELSGAETLAADLVARHGGVLAVPRELPEADWTIAWREGLGPRHVGALVLVPSWVTYQPAEGERLVTVDPESAFGSGEHGSTRAALRLLEAWLKPGDNMVDLGSGSGILAIAAARLGASRAVGIELDPEAMPVAIRNAERNGVSDRVRFLEGDAASLAVLLGPVDLVTSNILRSANQSLLAGVNLALRRGGTAIFSGMELAEATEFRAPLLAAGFTILRETIDDGWWAVAAERT
jgi:ribosomal protein L11 methyltransferase